MVQNQFNCNVKQIRTDNGTEFMSNTMQSYFYLKGIIHQRSCVDTPQQNGIVERKHRHLLEVARALRFQANLPISF
jgi:transposase InsO family protein